MMGSSTRSFDRAISISSIKIVKPQILLISGVCENIGKEAWTEHESGALIYYEMRYSLFQEGFPFPILSKSERFTERSIAPGALMKFSSSLIIPYVNRPEFSLEIDITRQSEKLVSFCELGATPAKVSFRVSAPENKDYLCSFSEISISHRPGKPCLISGAAKNQGEMPWKSEKNFGKGAFLLGLKIFRSPNFEDVLFEDRAHLNSPNLSPGESSDFLVSIPAQYVGPDMVLKLNILKEEEFWFDDRSGFSYLIDLGDSSLVSNSKKEAECPPFAAEIQIYSCALAHGFIVTLTGTIKNCGLVTWNSTQSHEGKIILGARLHDLKNPLEPRKECRASLRTGSISPGESSPFVLSFLTLDLETGRYLVEVDLLAEHQFWFSQKGGHPIQFSLSIEEPPSEKKSLNPDKKNRVFAMPQTPKECGILVIAPTVPQFDSEAGGKRLFQILKILVESGFFVKFLYESALAFESNQKYLLALKELGIHPQEGPISFLAQIDENQFQVCILAWHDCAERYLPTIPRVLPKAKIIIDSVDIAWIREARGSAEGLLDFPAQEIISRKATELRTYQSSDLVWVVTEDDRQAILREAPQVQTILVPLIYDAPEPKIEYRRSSNAIFIGGFGHTPNISAALEAAEICREFIRQTGEKLTLYIIGQEPPEKIKSLHDEKTVVVTGRVEELAPYLALASVMIAPLRFGAGLKGKICDAAYAGIPILTTSIGAEGLGFENGRDYFHAETKQEFIDSLKVIFSKEIDLRDMCRNAYQRTSQLIGKAVVTSSIRSSLLYPPIAIAIVTYNKIDLLKKCVSSILEKTVYPNLTICILSNGCIDGTREYLQDLEQETGGTVHALFNRENDYFVRPNNKIINLYPDHDIVLINNDIEILSEQWLTHLYHAAYSSPSIGAAGGLLLSPDQLVSEAGALIHAHGYCENIGRGHPPSLSHLQIPRIVDYCSGCFLYLRRDAISEIGVFDERFHPMYYEDVDWQVRLKHAGRQTLYTPLAKAIHYEGSSAGQDTEKGMKRFQEINRLKFIEKFPSLT